MFSEHRSFSDFNLTSLQLLLFLRPSTLPHFLNYLNIQSGISVARNAWKTHPYPSLLSLGAPLPPCLTIWHQHLSRSTYHSGWGSVYSPAYGLPAHGARDRQPSCVCRRKGLSQSQAAHCPARAKVVHVADGGEGEWQGGRICCPITSCESGKRREPRALSEMRGSSPR